MTDHQQSSLRRQLLLGIFVVSGFTGLIYESIWSHARAALASIPADSRYQAYRLPLRQLTAVARSAGSGAAEPVWNVRSADAWH